MLYLISSFFLFLVGLVSFIFSLCFINYNYVIFMDWDIVSINSCSLTMVLLLDWMSLMFMSFVLFISSMVVFYSLSYMSSDNNNIRFLYLVLLFVLSMLFMIISPNLVSILLGWDGLGLVSYGLVIYFQNYKSYNAGMLTILINRVGDAALLISIAWMFNFGSWHFLFYVGVWNYDMLMVFLMVVLASFTKSAQIPFSSWLPAAMAAPTPVSALVHSSTLVTAGVYLLIRFSYMFVNFNCNLFIYVGIMTMFVAGLGASLEFDLKKVIALSTLSQLGFMVGILFMGYSVLSFFHLLMHAFFKALLFLCAGLIIHITGNNQDLRSMGGIYSFIPWTYTAFLISNFSLCGIPFFSGFYSKDMILECMVVGSYNFYVILLYYLSVGLTVAYSLRMVYYTLGSDSLYCCQSYFEDNVMVFSMFFMSMMSIFGGSFLSWIVFSIPEVYCMPIFIKLMPVFVILVSSVFTYILCGSNYSFYSLGWVAGSMWFMPFFSTYLVSGFGLFISRVVYVSVDCSWGEYLISQSVFSFLTSISINMVGFYNNGIKLFLVSFILSSLFFFL